MRAFLALAFADHGRGADGAGETACGSLDTGARRAGCARYRYPMGFNGYFQYLVDFVRDNAVWAPAVMFGLAFAESLAFVSLLIPAWGALVAIGALIGAGGVSFWPVWIGAALGAACGDWLSYWIGQKLEYSVQHIWPLSRHPELIPRGEAFVKKWGVAGIFIGRFFGPLRAAVPLVAGIFEMPYWRFQIANVLSAFVWAAVLLTLGDFISKGIAWAAG